MAACESDCRLRASQPAGKRSTWPYRRQSESGDGTAIYAPLKMALFVNTGSDPTALKFLPDQDQPNGVEEDRARQGGDSHAAVERALQDPSPV